MEGLTLLNFSWNSHWAIIFILHVFDSPESIHPKYAVITIITKDSLKEIETELQKSVNQLVSWTKDNDMLVNQPKTKSMLFGQDVEDKVLSLEIDGLAIEKEKIFLSWTYS